MDTWPDGSFPRDPIEVNRLIDRWSMLGLPLMVSMNSPTDSQPDADTKHDAASRSDQSVGDGTNGDNSDTVDRQTSPPDRVSAWRTTSERAGEITPDSIVRLLLAKPSVHAIVWNKMVVEDNSTRGLWDQAGKAKPLLNSMASLRKVLLH